MNCSVITLVRRRPEHLANLIHALNAQSTPPGELVIAWMQDAPDTGLPSTCFPVRHVHVGGEALPLAAARNAGAAAASRPGLIFLDVDCIASPGLVAAYHDALDQGPGLYMGEVRYLPGDAVRRDSAGGIDYDRLAERAVCHPARPSPPAHAVTPEPDMGQLWGLSFALRRADHEAAGGMDEAYVGYGGEETDYARRLAAAGLSAYWVGDALAWHQHHVIHKPPLAHFEAIIANARRFRARWGDWCMDYWLGLFDEAGLIDWQPDGDEIVIHRRPSADEIRGAEQDPSICFS